MRNINIYGTTTIPKDTPTAAKLLQAVYTSLREKLPTAWEMNQSTEVRRENHVVGAQFHLIGPDSQRITITVEVKRTVNPKDIPFIQDQLQRFALPGEYPFVIAPFLSPTTRELLRKNTIGYADATGNLRLVIDSPVVYLESSGAKKNPWKEHTPLRSLKGSIAGRVVRALCDFRPPFGVRELAERSQTPLASVARVIQLLDREALVIRNTNGTVIDVRWANLIRRWTLDYALTTSNITLTYVDPRGLSNLLKKIEHVNWEYAITGSLAAVTIVPVAAPQLAALYVRDVDEAASALGLKKVEKGANVLLLQPFDSIVYDRTFTKERIVYAAYSQVAADLLTSPGRGPEEGQELLRWMEENEDVWCQ